MSSRLIIAGGDISSSPVLGKRFRGKMAKEVYRCAKGIALTGSVCKPLAFAISRIPGELTKGVIYTSIDEVGEQVIGYIAGIGFVRYLYKVVHPVKLKAIFRLAYNIGCLPLTIYYKGIGVTFDFLKVSKLEEMWFGHPVYIFDDNRLWMEANFTLTNIFDQME